MPLFTPDLTRALDRVKSLSGSTSSTSALSVSCTRAVMYNPTTGNCKFFNNIGATTLTITTSGPAAGGRDQSGAFSNGATVHVYFIGDEAGNTSVIGSTAAPATGPVLPAPYVYYAYATTVILATGTANLQHPQYFRGDKVFYSGLTQVAVSLGTATTETDLSANFALYVPSNATLASLFVRMLNSTGAANTNYFASIRVVTTVDFAISDCNTILLGGPENSSMPLEVPNISQNLYYKVNDSAMRVSIYVQGYTVEN